MPPPRPLIVTNDPDLLDDLLRLAAAADVEVDVAVDIVAARPCWPRAPLVLLGPDAAVPADLAAVPRRSCVLVVGREKTDRRLGGDLADLVVEAELALPDAEDEVVRRLAESVVSTDRARTIGVMGGCGGAGASVFAAALAVTAARRGPAVLVDLDLLGGGVDVLLGVEDVAGLRWPDLASASGRLLPSAVRDRLPVATRGGLRVLSHARHDQREPPAEAVQAVLDAACRGDGVVVLDLPRRPAVPMAAAIDAVVVVVPAEVRAVAAALSVVAGADRSTDVTGVVVRRPPAPTLTAEHVAESLALPLLGELRLEPGLAVLLNSGRPLRIRRRGPLAMLCDQLLDRWERPAEVAA